MISGLVALDELQMRAKEQTADHILASCTTLQMGHLVWRLSMMTLWTGSKQLHSTSDDTIGPKEKEEDLFE